MTCTSGCYYSF